MRKNKRKFALLLAATMLTGLLAGCGGSEETPQTEETGRFSETEIALPEGISDMQTMAKLDDGSLEVIASNSDTYCILRSSDMGENWDVTPLESLKDSYINPVAIAPDGTAALFEVLSNKKSDESYTFTYKLKLASPEGEIKEINFQIPSSGNEDAMISGAAYDSGGNLFVQDTDARLLKINTEDGSCSQPFDTDGKYISYFSIAGKTLCAVNTEGIMLFDTETGEALDAESTMDDIVKNTDYGSVPGYDRGAPMLLAEGDDGSILIVNHEGIFRHTLGGSVNEQLANGELNSLNDTNLILLSAVMMDTNNIVVAAFADGGKEKILHYTYDANASAVPEKELSVYALEDSALLRQAVTIFQKNNPDIYVKLEIGTSGEDGVTAEDALKVLNTNIMAGKGPDVLILDGMPIDSYIEKNILEDISDIVDEVDKEDGLFDNIKAAYRQDDGKQYTMPMRFYTSIVTGDAESVAAGSSLKKLADRAESLKKQGNTPYVLMPRRTDDLLIELYCMDSASWKKEDGTVDTDKLKEYLTQAKRLHDVDEFSKELIPETSYWGEAQMYGSAENIGNLMGMTQIGFGTFAGISQMQMLYSVQAQNGNTFGLMDTDSAKSFAPYLLTGVVSGGDTDTAKQFVKALLGKEANSGAENGFSVNRAAYEAACKDDMAETDQSISSSIHGGDGEQRVDVDILPLTQENIDSCTAMLESLTEPSMTDRVVQNLVLEQGQKYLDGTQDLDTTVKEIQKKINLYLSE
ncbi:MAG: hypothetical protein LUE11_04390 [Clostridia bacterium]|nr:hypothetical protein [Clostridia bacterium]